MCRMSGRIIQDELTGERTARRQADRERNQAVAALQETQKLLRDTVAEQQKAQMPLAAAPTLKPSGKARTAGGAVQTIHEADVQTGAEGDSATARTPVTEVPDAAATVHIRRRRGRPPKVRQPGGVGFRRMVEAGLARAAAVTGIRRHRPTADAPAEEVQTV